MSDLVWYGWSLRYRRCGRVRDTKAERSTLNVPAGAGRVLFQVWAPQKNLAGCVSGRTPRSSTLNSTGVSLRAPTARRHRPDLGPSHPNKAPSNHAECHTSCPGTEVFHPEVVLRFENGAELVGVAPLAGKTFEKGGGRSPPHHFQYDHGSEEPAGPLQGCSLPAIVPPLLIQVVVFLEQGIATQ
jgi:hypothetical protein